MKILRKAVSIVLSLVMCATLSAPALAASFAELQGVIDSGNSLVNEETQEVRIGYNEGAVTLNENVEGAGHALVSGNKDITIDLNGHSINGFGTYVVGVAGGSELTVTDSSESSTGSINGSGTTTVINNQGTFNLEAGTVHADKGYGILTKGDATVSEDAVVKVDSTTAGTDRGVNISGGTLDVSGTITGGYIGVYANGGTVEVNGGIVDAGKYGVYATNNATVDITDGEIKATTNGVRIQNGSTGTVTGGIISTTERLEPGTTNGTTAIAVFGKQNSDGTLPYGETTLNVSGGTITGPNTAISGNGTKGSGGTVINITGGTISGGATAIYHPQIGQMTIDGGNITGGSTGIEVRAGHVTVNGGSIVGEAEEFSARPEGSGGTTVGAGLAVVQHTTQENISVIINGGTITGAKGLFEGNVQNNSEEAIQQVHPVINGGNIISTDESVESEDEQFFVSSGKFTKEVAQEYLVDGTANFAVDFDSTVPNSDKLHFQVGKELTGTGYNPDALSIDDTIQLAPSYQLDGASVEGTITGVMLPVEDAEGETSTVKTGLIESWSSADEAIASVDENGLVTANGAGVVTITATLYNGETVTFTVTVSEPAEEPTPEEPVIPEEPTFPDDAFFGGADGGEEETIEDGLIPLASGPITRAEFIDYLWRHEGEPEGAACTFVDVPEDHEYVLALGWAQEHGIAVAYEDGTFEPDELVTVGAAREFLTNFAAYAEMEMPRMTTLSGADEDVLLTCDAVIAEFFGQPIPTAPDAKAEDEAEDEEEFEAA